MGDIPQSAVREIATRTAGRGGTLFSVIGGYSVLYGAFKAAPVFGLGARVVRASRVSAAFAEGQVRRRSSFRFRRFGPGGEVSRQYGHLPAQPDDKSRVWGVNSFAALPIFGGELLDAGAAARLLYAGRV